MRVGINPEKAKETKNILKNHRVVVVFYVPESDEEYYASLDQVLDKCLESLVNTINPLTTNITLINNASGPKVQRIIDKYIGQIDKYVNYTENKGKVFAVLNEVRGVFEEFVTISDADILFYNGWESAVFDVFKNHPKAGVVSPHPCPYVTFYYNKSVFGMNSLSGNVAYGKYVSDEDIDLYTQGTNLPKVIDRKNAAFNWKEKQYILKHPVPVVIGAYHVVSTYRAAQFHNVFTFPELKFTNNYEEGFIDFLAEEKGWYRLSTLTSYIYHMGNVMDDVCKMEPIIETELISPDIFKEMQSPNTGNPMSIYIKRTIGRIFIKFKWNR